MNDKRLYLTLMFLLGLAGVILMVVSFATDHWVISYPAKKNANVTEANNTKKHGGVITLGLFKGKRMIDYGLGERVSTFEVKDLKNKELINFGLWVSTIVFLSLAVVWGLIAIGFTVYNIFGKPIETVTGEMGLYLWHGVTFLFALLAVLLYVIFFVENLQEILLEKKDVEHGYTTEDRSYFDYSFYCLVGAAGAFVINMILLCMSGQKCWCSYSHAGEKEIDNGMILY